MNETFELSKDDIEKIRAIGERLCDNYDPEVIAFEAGQEILELLQKAMAEELSVPPTSV